MPSDQRISKNKINNQWKIIMTRMKRQQIIMIL